MEALSLDDDTFAAWAAEGRGGVAGLEGAALKALATTLDEGEWSHDMLPVTLTEETRAVNERTWIAIIKGVSDKMAADGGSAMAGATATSGSKDTPTTSLCVVPTGAGNGAMGATSTWQSMNPGGGVGAAAWLEASSPNEASRKAVSAAENNSDTAPAAGEVRDMSAEGEERG